MATASAMVSEVGVLSVCISCVVVARRVLALAVWSSDYRSDDQVGAPVVMWYGLAGMKGAQKVVGVGEERWSW